MNKVTWSLALIFSYAYMMTMNTLANSLPLNNKTTGQLSDEFPNYFVPAGITFAIWGIIFLLLLLFVVFSIYRLIKNENKEWDKSLYGLIVVNFLLNGSWIIAWHYGYVFISVVIMLALLYTLIRLRILTYDHEYAWLYRVAVSIYLGWISVATVANFTTLFVDLNIQGGVELQQIASSAMIVVLLTLTFYMNSWKKDFFFPLVAIWALYGIYLKQPGSEWYLPGSVAIASLFLIAANNLFQAGKTFIKK